MTVAPGHPRGAASAIIVVGGDVTVSITVGRPGGDREEAVSVEIPQIPQTNSSIRD